MKTLKTTLLFSLIFASSAAFADEHMNMKEEMMKCDTNKDGMISKDEFIKSKTEMFMKMDKDTNAKLDASEQKMMMDKMHMMNHGDNMQHENKEHGMMKKDM